MLFVIPNHSIGGQCHPAAIDCGSGRANNAKCKTENAKCKTLEIASVILHFAFSVLHFALLLGASNRDASMHELFEHTADLGLRIRAADLDTLFVEAAQCLFSAVVEDLATVRPLQKVDIRFPTDDVELLLFDWLRQLLYHLDAEHLLFGKFEVHVTAAGVTASA